MGGLEGGAQGGPFGGGEIRGGGPKIGGDPEIGEIGDFGDFGGFWPFCPEIRGGFGEKPANPVDFGGFGDLNNRLIRGGFSK